MSPALPRRLSSRSARICLAFAWVVSSLYIFHLLDHNWIPHDDGLLAQGAERVLLGELPHRDFAEVYTGGLDYLNALGFKVFGMQLMALRYILFGFVVLWVPAFYYCAARFVSPVGAAAATLLAAIWTVPNYPAAMPSWYNLFFATFGAAALLRYTDDPRRRWLFVAGAMGGCSTVVKITGFYYVAGALLFLVVHEALVLSAEDGSDARGGAGHRWMMNAALLTLVATLVGLLRRHLTIEHAYHFLLPGAAVACATFRIVSTSGLVPSTMRLSRLWSLTWPFLLGLGIPVVLFAWPYIDAAAAGALMRGLFVTPTTRLGSVARPPVPWPAIIPALLLALTLIAAFRAGRGPRAWLPAAVYLFLPATAWIIGGAEFAYAFSWASVAQAIPLVVTVGLVILLREPAAEPRARESSFLLLAIAAFGSLIEYPFSGPIYFCFTAPIALLALLSLFRLAGRLPRPSGALLAAYYAAFAVFVLNHQSINEFGLTAARAEALARLDLPRGGVLVGVRDADQYRAAVDSLKAHARGGYAYAGPDAPEVYFLSGLRNPTRAFFDFLEPAQQSADTVLAAVDRHGVTAILINRAVKLSSSLSPELEARFAQRFPHQECVGKFTLRWQ